jgi:hypothetical protein
VSNSPAGSWLDRVLPARGFERAAILILAALTIGLKIVAIYHLRSDSDETQHAHVVWGWVTGQLQYRDYFDNHMPLFQMLCAPLMALIGPRADIMIWLRWAMLPLYLISLACIFRLTAILYSYRAAPWTTLCAAAAWKFFLTSTEFRTDDLWTAFWFAALVVGITGQFTVRRAFMTGLLIGLSGAVSIKTVPLAVALGTAAALAFLFAWCRGERWPVAGAFFRFAAGAVAAAIAPGAMALYFAAHGAFGKMYYCVISHNLVPGLKRWGNFSLHQWYFPLSVLVFGAYGWFIFSQTPDRRLAIRRAIIHLVPWLYLFLLFSYWPDITREDDLPYVPLIPLSLIPLLIAAGARVRDERWGARFRAYALPAVVLCELIGSFKAQNLREDRLRVTTHNIADVLALTGPNDYAMDDKGDYVFRRRPYYWVLEPITKARFRMGLIKDSIPDHLVATGTKICSIELGRPGSLAAVFIAGNYLPFDPETRDMGVLGKIIGSGTGGGAFAFDVAIPQTYAIVTETGTLVGNLDGKPYAGPLWIAAGKHVFQRTSGGGRVAIFLNAALLKGFSPLYDVAESNLKNIGTLRLGKRGTPELQ